MTFFDSKAVEIADSVIEKGEPIVDLLDLQLAYVGGGIGDTVL